MKNFILKLTIIFIFVSCFNKSYELKISPLFSDGMVLQRKSNISIWGKFTPNTIIKIDTEWGEKLKLESDTIGNWIGQIPTPEAGGPYTMNVSSGDERINIKDILIGEVWIASGQSNMEMTLEGFPPNELIFSFTH